MTSRPELRRRMQGKACFNFTRVDEALFAELATLTADRHRPLPRLSVAARSTLVASKAAR